jgi:hypothetical protein
MWDTAAATEHNAESASASERRLAADGAAATEHSEESANAFERHVPARPSLALLHGRVRNLEKWNLAWGDIGTVPSSAATEHASAESLQTSNSATASEAPGAATEHALAENLYTSNSATASDAPGAATEHAPAENPYTSNSAATSEAPALQASAFVALGQEEAAALRVAEQAHRPPSAGASVEMVTVAQFSVVKRIATEQRTATEQHLRL